MDCSIDSGNRAWAHSDEARARSIKVSKRFGRTTHFLLAGSIEKGARSAAAVVFTSQPFLPPSNPRDECRREGEDEELRICQEGNGRRDGKQDHLTEMTLQCPVWPLALGFAKNVS